MSTKGANFIGGDVDGAKVVAAVGVTIESHRNSIGRGPMGKVVGDDVGNSREDAFVVEVREIILSELGRTGLSTNTGEEYIDLRADAKFCKAYIGDGVRRDILDRILGQRDENRERLINGTRDVPKAL